MSRTTHTSLLIVALALWASSGCVDQDASLLLEGHIVRVAEADEDGNQIGTCEFPDGADTQLILQGFIDLAVLKSANGGQPGQGVPNLFTFGARMTNRLPANDRVFGQGNTRLDTNAALITGAEVTFTFNSGAQKFDRSFSSVLRSGGGTLNFDLPLLTSAADVEAITALVNAELASFPAATRNDFKVPVFVDITVKAETMDGSGIASNTFTFPMEICLSCNGQRFMTPICVLVKK